MGRLNIGHWTEEHEKKGLSHRFSRNTCAVMASVRDARLSARHRTQACFADARNDGWRNDDREPQKRMSFCP